MSKEITNQEIRDALLKLHFDCGPVTDTTREVHLKKLRLLESRPRKKGNKLTDEDLMAQLTAFGVTVAPITSTNRHIYARRLEALKTTIDGQINLQSQESVHSSADGCGPMDID